MSNLLNNINAWKSKLGLLPIPLFEHPETEDNSFVMLNGSKGNFCLAFDKVELGPLTRNHSWSCDVGHYVTVADDVVKVQKWNDGFSRIETYSERSVHDRLDKFHAYLEKNSPQHSLSAIAHSIKVFRMLRGSLGPGFSSEQNLLAFLYLLTYTSASLNHADIDLSLRGLPESAQQVALQIKSPEWDQLVELLARGRKVDELSLVVDLLLRHAAGRLFQEAHYETIFSSQLDLFSAMPSIARISQNVPKSTGVHYTPSSLVRMITEATLSDELLMRNSLTIFDPACGSGEFLREAVRQLSLKGYNGHVKVVGWDISSIACHLALFAVTEEKKSVSFALEIDVVCVDAIAPDTIWPSNVDIILMNPPFVSTSNLEKEQKNNLEIALGDTSKGRADYSFAFVKKSVHSLTEQGVLGCLIPASFLDGTSASKLRNELSEITSVNLLAKLGDNRLFSGAMVDVVIYVAERTEGNTSDVTPPVVFWSDHRPKSTSKGSRTLRKIRNRSGSLLDLPILDEGYSIYFNPNIGRADQAWMPRPYKAWQLLNSLDHLEKVGGIFDVRQGARTGNNKVFLIGKDYYKSLPEREKPYFRPSVVNASLVSGVLADSTYLFFPSGDYKISTEQELSHLLKNYYHDKLLPNREQLLRREMHREWWELTRPRNWQYDPSPKIVSTYFGDRGSFSFDNNGEYAVVQGFAWLPKAKYKTFQPITDNLGYAYVAILNSDLFSTLLSATSNPVSGGQWNLSTKFVGKMKIPNLFKGDVPNQIIMDLSHIGKAICSHGLENVDNHSLRELVRYAYNLNVNDF